MGRRIHCKPPWWEVPYPRLQSSLDGAEGVLQDLDTLKVIRFMLLTFSLPGKAVASSQTAPGSLGLIHPAQHLFHGVAAEDGVQVPKYNSSHQGWYLCCLHGSVTGIILPVTLP